MRVSDYIALLGPLSVVFASYFFGLATKSYERKIVAAKERYQHLYIPYMRWLVHAPLNWVSPGIYKSKYRDQVMTLLLDNAQFMGLKSSQFLPNLYDAYLNLYEFEQEIDFTHTTAVTDYNDCFISMSHALLEEATELSKKLKLPNLAATTAASYQIEEDRVEPKSK